MIIVFLGALAGTCFYAAIHHFHIGLRLRPRSPHLLLALAGLAFGAMALLNTLSYREVSIATAETQQKTAVALALLGALALYWFVGLRSRAPRPLMLGIAAVILVAVGIDVLSPAGLLIDRVRGFEPVALPWGDIFYRPLGQPSQLERWVLMPAVLLPLAFLAWAIGKLWRQGRPGEALALAAILAIPVVPSILDLAMHGPGELPLPVVETALATAMLLLGLVTASDLAGTASLETDLEKSEARFRRLIETSPEAIGLYDTERDRFVAVNRQIEELFGRPADEIQALELDEIVSRVALNPETGAAWFREHLAGALQGEAVVAEPTVRRPDGTLVPCELRLAALDSLDGSLVRISLLDISARKQADQEREQLEDRLHRTQKLETLGTLAGGIAHDFNNMLTPVVGYGEMAAQELEDQHPARAYLNEILMAAGKAHQLTSDILTFSRRTESTSQPIEVQSTIERACRFLRATLPARIRIETDLDAPDVRVLGDADQLQQIVMSLGTNAAQAMPGGGALRVSLREHGGDAVLEVTDSGTGMDADTAARIFDPFFTTKETGRASGLGLSVVHGTVTGWEGDIDVHTAPGEGSTFRITLPGLVMGAAP